jgi:hypothetical protein
MAQAETHEHNEYAGPSAFDVIVAMLAAFTVAGIVWATGVGVVAGINFAGEYFQIYPPANELIANAIQTAFALGPILAAIPAAWFTYRFVVRLP